MSEMFNKIVITGATGFLGHHVTAALKAQTNSEVIPLGRKDYDLLEAGAPERLLKDLDPDCVIHMAAKSAGIIANKKYPADFFYDNLAMNLHMFEAAFRHGVKKFLTFMGGCSYPAHATSPIDEEQMWNGYPQPESAGYSVAKKMLLVQSDTYRRQHDFNSVVLIPGNLYGEWDNFNMEQAHVIPALVRRYLEAKEQGKKEVICYGSGRPTRDFVYAADVGQVVPWFLANYNSSDPVNISSGTRTSIKELAEAVKTATGFEGELVWDTEKPDGQMDKIFSVERLHALGLSCDTPLKDGLKNTVEWFLQARENNEVRL